VWKKHCKHDGKIEIRIQDGKKDPSMILYRKLQWQAGNEVMMKLWQSQSLEEEVESRYQKNLHQRQKFTEEQSRSNCFSCTILHEFGKRFDYEMNWTQSVYIRIIILEADNERNFKCYICDNQVNIVEELRNIYLKWRNIYIAFNYSICAFKYLSI